MKLHLTSKQLKQLNELLNTNDNFTIGGDVFQTHVFNGDIKAVIETSVPLKPGTYTPKRKKPHLYSIMHSVTNIGFECEEFDELIEYINELKN